MGSFYGSITLTDITDIGEFSVTPSCNKPLTVLYDPSSDAYIPDWSSEHLVVTPIMYYGGTQVTASNGATVTWTRRVNSDPATALTADETVSNNVLTVSARSLSATTGPTITYICTATYTEPRSKVTLTAEGQISFTLVRNAVDGANAMYFYLYSMRNAFYDDDRSDITMYSKLINGATEITSNITYRWYRWSGSGYTEIVNETGSTLVVTANDVSSYASFKCEATYDSTVYTAYGYLMDKTDPIQVGVMSSIGNQIKNRVGVGAIYVRVTRNGTELDPMYGEPTFCESKPETLVSGNYYYLISNHNVTLYQATSTTEWIVQSNPHGRDGCGYSWTFRDANGDVVTTYTIDGTTYSYPTTGKVIYIDGDMVDDKIIADVSVTVATGGSNTGTMAFGSITVTDLVDRGITATEDWYKLSSSSTETFPADGSGWTKKTSSTTIPVPTASQKYLWYYEITTYSDGTTSTWGPVVIGTYGEKGDVGVGYVSEARLFYLKNSSTAAPDAPTSAVTNTSTAANVWTTKEPAWQSGYYYWTCHQFEKTDGTYTWTDVILDSALSSANETAAAAQAAAASATTIANSKAQVTYGTTTPTVAGTERAGDIYIQKSTGGTGGDVTWLWNSETGAWVQNLTGTTTIVPGSIGTTSLAANSVTADILNVSDINASGSLSISALTNDAQQAVLNSVAVATANSYTDEQFADYESDVSSLDSRLTTAESSITQNATNIALKVSQTDYTGSTIASLINQSASTVQINAAHINLVGSVSITDLDSSVQEDIAEGSFAYARATAVRGTCSTGATTAAKVVTCAGFSLATGSAVTVYFSTANTKADAALTLNVNDTGAKTIYVSNAATSSTNQLLWVAGSSITFVYDGNYWRVADNPGTWDGDACSVAAGTAAKTTTAAGIIVFKGVTVSVPMTYANTNASATLNVSSLGAKAIYYGTTSTRPTTSNGRGWVAGRTVDFRFDGAYWRLKDTGTIVDGGHIMTGTIDADRIDVASIDTQELNLYGTMSVYTDSTHTTEGGKLGYTTGNYTANSGLGIVLASPDAHGVAIAGENGVFIGYNDGEDSELPIWIDGDGESAFPLELDGGSGSSGTESNEIILNTNAFPSRIVVGSPAGAEVPIGGGIEMASNWVTADCPMYVEELRDMATGGLFNLGATDGYGHFPYAYLSLGINSNYQITGGATLCASDGSTGYLELSDANGYSRLTRDGLNNLLGWIPKPVYVNSSPSSSQSATTLTLLTSIADLNCFDIEVCYSSDYPTHRASTRVYVPDASPSWGDSIIAHPAVLWYESGGAGYTYRWVTINKSTNTISITTGTRAKSGSVEDGTKYAVVTRIMGSRVPALTT